MGSILDCFNCLSLWIALPIAAIVANGWAERLLLWLALSAVAILLERLAHPAPAAFIEDEAATKE